jgi:hypothetical protein
MEIVRSSETSVMIDQSTWRHIPEDINLQLPLMLYLILKLPNFKTIPPLKKIIFVFSMMEQD